MKRLSMVLLLVALGVGLFPAVAPAAAPTVGEKISLFMGDRAFPAGESFFIQHRWACFPDVHAVDGCGSMSELRLVDFRLFVDGQEVHGPTQVTTARGDDGRPYWSEESHTFNFRQGMTGTHEFTGVFTQGGVFPETGDLEITIIVTFE